jgi:hypothetical protein
MKTTFRAAEATRQLEHEDALRQQHGQQHHKVRMKSSIHTNITLPMLQLFYQDYPISAGHIVTAVS